jgi:hypothetical protein
MAEVKFPDPMPFNLKICRDEKVEESFVGGLNCCGLWSHDWIEGQNDSSQLPEGRA